MKALQNGKNSFTHHFHYYALFAQYRTERSSVINDDLKIEAQNLGISIHFILYDKCLKVGNLTVANVLTIYQSHFGVTTITV